MVWGQSALCQTPTLSPGIDLSDDRIPAQAEKFDSQEQGQNLQPTRKLDDRVPFSVVICRRLTLRSRGAAAFAPNKETVLRAAFKGLDHAQLTTFLVDRRQLQPNQSIFNIADEYAHRIALNLPRFQKTVREFIGKMIQKQMMQLPAQVYNAH